MRGYIAVFRTQLLLSVAEPYNLVSRIVFPLLLCVLLVLPRIEALSVDGAGTVVLSGVLLASMWGASLWGAAGVIRRERAWGTFASSMCGRLSPAGLLVAKTAGGVLFDLALIGVALALFVAGAGVDLVVRAPIAYVMGILALPVCGIASSVLIGAALTLTRYGFQLTTALGTPILLLGGTIIPLDRLPAWLALPGRLVNLSWLRLFLESCVNGSPAWDPLGLALLTSAVYAVLGVLALRVVLKRAKVEGTLELA